MEPPSEVSSNMGSGLDPFSEPAFICKHCHKSFREWEDLLSHKQQKTNDDKEDHIHCKICARDYKTLAGELLHMQLVSQSENRQ
jgi:general transcription factor 3C polypeptide 5 (transcription factor C subunit 1)